MTKLRKFGQSRPNFTLEEKPMPMPTLTDMTLPELPEAVREAIGRMDCDCAMPNGCVSMACSREDYGTLRGHILARAAFVSSREPVAIAEYVLALLISGGRVTQAVVDQARAIALGIDQPFSATPSSHPAGVSEGYRLLTPAEALRRYPTCPTCGSTWFTNETCNRCGAELVKP